MRLRRSRSGFVAAVPTASMADIAFLLIVFFMVTTAYSLDRTPMELPETTQQEQTQKGSAIISITQDEVYRFSSGEEDASLVDGIGGLAQAIRSVTAANKLHPFVLKADRRVKYRVIDQVLEQLRSAGAENVTLLSQGEARP